jgi:hypothetical protein
MRLLPCLAVILGVSPLWGCGFEAPKPVRTAAPIAPPPPLSTLSATLTIPADQLARLVNNTTEYGIADLRDRPIKCAIGRCLLNLRARRTGPVMVSAENGTLGLRLPFAMQAQLQTPGILSFLHAQGDAQGIAVAQTNLSISPELQLNSKTSGTLKLDDARLRLGSVTADVSQILDDNQDQLSRPLWRMLDSRVAKLPLRAEITALWIGAFTPLRVGRSPLSWLILRPEELGVAQPRVEGRAVTVSVSLSARSQVFVQDNPPANPPTPLPTVTIMAKPSDDFRFIVPVLLPYERAAQLAMASLTKNPPRIAGFTTRINALQILPSGRDVVVTLNFCAGPHWDPFGWFASCGVVYLRGTPAFDAIRQTVSIQHLHYDIASANLMLRTLHALAGDVLTARLEQDLTFDESRDIARLESRLTSVLEKPQGQGLTIAAHVQSFGTPSFMWTATGFLAQCSVQGKVETRLNL